MTINRLGYHSTIIAVLIVLMATSSAYAQEPQAGFTIFVSRDGTIESVRSADSQAGEFDRCQLCSLEFAEKYGNACENAPAELEICKGLTKATVHDIETIHIFTSHHNPDCKVIKKSGGNVVWARPQGCAH